MAKEKWSKDIKLDEGSLGKLGWPNAGKLIAAVRSGRITYKEMINKLSYLANITKDKATETKARAIIVRLQNEIGPKDGKKK